MPKRFIDPFLPNRPVDDPSRFLGREEQVEEVVDALFQLSQGSPRHCVISGDRGIGKSSLLLQAKLLAEGENALADRLEIDKGVEQFNFVTAWHDADPGQRPVDLVHGLLRHLRTGARGFLGKLTIELDWVLTVKKQPQSDQLGDLIPDFCGQVAALEKQFRSKGRDGLIFLVDELDRAAADSGVATFFKLVAERLAREGIHHVGFLAAGITGAVSQLEEDHGSIFRTLRDIPLPRFTRNETSEILQDGFEKVGRAYSDDIAGEVHRVSGGFPEPVHLLGSEMLSVDSDGAIDREDLDAAKHKIITDVRRNKLNTVLRSAGFGKYQKILAAMADHSVPDVPLDVISNAIGYKQNQYSTNMSTLVDRGIIMRTDRGVYAFVDPLLKEYIQHFGVISVDGDDEESGE